MDYAWKFKYYARPGSAGQKSVLAWLADNWPVTAEWLMVRQLVYVAGAKYFSIIIRLEIVIV